MCGMNVLIGGDQQQIEAMNDAIAHRGLRSKAQEMWPGVWFGHVRLPIQGLEEGYDHPVRIAEHSLMLVGEILNLKELGYAQYRTDTIPLLAEHRRQGISVFRQLDGFWAVAIADDKQRMVRIVTDGLAKKPLYARTDPDFYAVSSEMKALLALGSVEWDREYLSAVMKWGYCPIPRRTPFRNIHALAPFSDMVISDIEEDQCRLQTESYDRYRPDGDISLRRALTEAVENRLISDVPISVLVSGGLDSTIIFELIRRRTQEFTVFHVDNGEEEYLNYLNIPSTVRVRKLALEPAPFFSIIEANETPVDLGSMQQQYQLGRAIHDEGFKVAISGDGADELFGGYGRAQTYDSQWSDVFHELVNYHCPRLDRMMMAHAVELRCPFLSRPVIEYALSLNYAVRTRKQALKFEFMDIVPKAILDRDKWALKNTEVILDPTRYRKKMMTAFTLAFKSCVDDPQPLQMFPGG